MPDQSRPVTIIVNNKTVNLPDHKTTGRGIKEAAIAQSVAIQLTFQLFRITGSSQHPVPDAEELTAHDQQQFRAVAADDNS